MSGPKPSTFPAIRRAVIFYEICAAITGVMLLLLVAEMITKYGFGYELFTGGSGGFLWLAPTVETANGTVSSGDGLNLSTGLLIAHGWFYVVYLFSCFRLWSLMRWRAGRFIILAGGGVVPFLSFVMEILVARQVKAFLAAQSAEQTIDQQPTGVSA